MPATAAPTKTARSVLVDGRLEVPLGIETLDDFRNWARSEDFPERGRIDFIDGRIEVDTMVEDVFLHGTPKSEIARVICNRVKEHDLGDVLIDRTRVSCPEADLSVEPDIVFISHTAVAAGRVQFVKSRADRDDSFMEIVGAPDLIVEVVSDSSVEKDTDRLFERYGAAGIDEYWLVDAREADLLFRIHTLEGSRYAPAPVDQDGFQQSPVLGAAYRFERTKRPSGLWSYRLYERE